MNYELAKELKDAGFPQQKRIVYSRSGDFVNADIIPKDVHYPTLSELIAACGEDFATLYYSYGEVEKREWEAKSVMKSSAGEYPIIQCEGKGSTPEEAVARLWLALNKK